MVDAKKYRGFLIAGLVVAIGGAGLLVSGLTSIFYLPILDIILESFESLFSGIGDIITPFFYFIGYVNLIIGICVLIVGAVLLIYGYSLYRKDRGYV